MNFLRCMASFRITAEELDPFEISEILGIEPSTSYKKGEQITSTTKKGKLLMMGFRRFGFWSINSEEKENKSLEQHIKNLLILLEPLKDELTELLNKGYEMDFFCGIFSDGCPQSGFDIEPDVLLKLGQLNIKLDVCLY